MKRRNTLVFALIAASFAVLWALVPAPSQQPAGARSDAPYHATDMSKPQGSGGSSTTKGRLAVVPISHKSSVAGLEKISILPSSISLLGPRYGQRILVEGKFIDGHEEELTSQAIVSVSDSGVAKVGNDDVVLPLGDGQATITATLQGRRATAPLTVKGFSSATSWSFRNDVLPVMTKVGCNSGPCHGAAAGKNGFKLTLRGFDPIADYYTLTRQALARRTDRLEPAKSLILLKPTLTIPHGGGRRFPVASPEYKIISGWIAHGMPAPRDSDPLVTDIQVLPHEASLAPSFEQQLIVTAVFSDGHTADVTRWAKYDSGDEGVATVDNNGIVTMHGYGEGPGTVWF
jgi:hypothetical protein